MRAHPAWSPTGAPARRSLVLLGWLACALPALALPRFDEVREDFRSSETRVLDRNGHLVQRVRTDASVRRGDWVALADVSPALRTALVYSEDRRFYEHSGVDWRAVSAAAWGNLWNQRTRGASTLTMQLAGLLDDDWRRTPGGRSVVQKIGQAAAAQGLERHWRKDQILEAYLNLVPLRGEIVGIDALSRTLFGKAPHGLDAREAAVTAALVRAPNAPAAQVARRACGVLRELQAPALAGATDCEALDLFTTAALQRRAYRAAEGVAPHFARQVLREQAQAAQGRERAAPPRTVTSSLRAPLQRFAAQALEQHLRELRGRQVEDGALVVLDNATGEVLAWVGSSGSLSQASEVDGVLAWRQPGSTLKPFLYAQALAERRLTAASLLEDSPAHIPTANGLYIPQNYDRQFKGWVSVRTALASSLNVPAVRTLVMLSPDALAEQLRALGIALRESGSYYGFSLALGSAEVPLLQLANAYRALANGGRPGPVRFTPAARPAPPGTQSGAPVLDPLAAFIVGDILSDPHARAPTFGLDSVLATRFWTAVKTGTSKDMRDNWAVGWSARYTVGVWVGNASGAPMQAVSGTSGAAPVWAAVMGFLHAQEPSRPPRPPAALLSQAVRFGPGPDGTALEAARREWFVPGTQQAVFAVDDAIDLIAARAYSQSTNGQKGVNPPPVPQPDTAALARIVAPAPGTVVALDPDIPPDRQRLRFEAVGAPQGARWAMAGQPPGQGNPWLWRPWPGRHRVELLDARGQVLDGVSIEVRGAGVAAPPRAGAGAGRGHVHPPRAGPGTPG